MSEPIAGCSKDSPQYWPESPFPEEAGDSTPHLSTEALGEDYVQYSKNTSDYQEKEPENNERILELTDAVREKLIMNREMEKLTEFLDARLAECGWKVDIRNILRESQEGKSKKKVTVEELYDLVKERAKMLVPRQIRKEMVYKIEESFHVEMDEEDLSSDGFPSV